MVQPKYLAEQPEQPGSNLSTASERRAPVSEAQVQSARQLVEDCMCCAQTGSGRGKSRNSEICEVLFSFGLGPPATI